MLKEAGWRVLGPEAGAGIFADGLRIGVRDPRDPRPSVRLLLDTFVAVGIGSKDSPAGDFLSSASSISCCLFLGQ